VSLGDDDGPLVHLLIRVILALSLNANGRLVNKFAQSRIIASGGGRFRGAAASCLLPKLMKSRAARRDFDSFQ